MEIFEIKLNLFQGTKIDHATEIVENKIDTVIDLEGGIDNLYSLRTNSINSYLYWHILDAPWLPNIDNLWNISRYAFNCWKQGMRILVHCTQGRNRSGLVNGCILWLDGMTGVDAVKLIQEKRPGALVNPIFRHYLENLSERR